MSLAFGEQACRCLVSFFWFAVLLGGVGVPSLSSRHTCVALVSLVLARRAAPPHPSQVNRLALWVCLGGHGWFCLGLCVLCLSLCLGALAWGQSRQPRPCGNTVEVNRVVLRGVASHASRAARQSETTNTEPAKPPTNPHNPQHATHNTRPRQRTQAPKGILRWVPWHRQFDWVARVCFALVSLPILVSVFFDC